MARPRIARTIPVTRFRTFASALFANPADTCAPVNVAAIHRMSAGISGLPPIAICDTAPVNAVNVMMKTLVPTAVFSSYPRTLGSQIFELNGFEMAAAKLVDVAASWRKNYDYTAQVINVGGGFGIKYVQEDHPLKPEEFVKAIVKTIKDEATKHNFPLPEIDIEPGRSIVGPAGYNLYKVGSMKEIPGLVPYVAVDGGMGDNIRPALYQAKYETVLANDPQRKASQEFHVAGKYCESGDILADAKLPLLKAGDILAMLDTGAYGYSMASNYNRNPRPAVVFAEDGKAQVVIRRESLEDLVHLDQDYNI